MAVHPSGNGSAWVENIDVDQPHGLDYRAWNHLAIGVRKRLEKGHQTLGDTTAGGEHIPGGAGVLGIGDGTPVVDGTFQGRGLVWDGTSVLWCSTDTAEATTCDFTILTLNPNSQWNGQDVTWAGAHQFDASVSVLGASEFSDAVFDGSVDISGALDCSVLTVDGSADISGAVDCSVLSVDGSADFGGDVSFGGSIKVDGTSTEFGGTAGLGLFYDPTSGGLGDTTQSVTFPNGLIMKGGENTNINAADSDVSFNTAFPSKIISVQLTMDTGSDVNQPVHVKDILTTGFTIDQPNAVAMDVYWLAIGY